MYINLTFDTIPTNKSEKVYAWMVEAWRFNIVDMNIATDAPNRATVSYVMVVDPMIGKA